MWANLLAWRSHQEGLQREFVAQREAEIAEQRAKFNERLEAERLQKERLAAGKLAAEQLLAEHAPEKDAEVTVDGVTGKVFWKGVKYYRNSWRSTVGVKDKYGTAHWIDIKKFMPAVEKAPRRRARRVAEAT